MPASPEEPKPSVSQMLYEVFDRGLREGEEKLSATDLELFLIWDFVIEFEMGSLTGYLYNRVTMPGRLAATASALEKYRVEPLATVVAELAHHFRAWKNHDDQWGETWDDVRTRFISDARLEVLDEKVTSASAKDYGLKRSTLHTLAQKATRRVTPSRTKPATKRRTLRATPRKSSGRSKK